jgi:uncharacterized protein (TIGR00297 family)
MVESWLVYIGIIVLSFCALWLKALSVSGALGAMLVGSAVYNGMAINGLLLLALFFGSSTIWSKFKKSEKKSFDDKLEKNDQRDFIQVMVNGGPAALMSLLFAVTGLPLFERLFIISLAAANSDTWASELGTLSKGNPYLLTTFQQVERGTSGAISLLGTSAALIGSFVIVLGAYILPFSITSMDLVILTFLGFAGSAADTIAGALLQVVYTCPRCGIETERLEHCDTACVPIRGLPLINNDIVNLLSNLTALFLGVLLYAWG